MKIRLFTIPNLLTLSNLMCGSLAILSALVFGRLDWSFWLLLLAATFDFLDGFAARLLKCVSPIGVELDSLADMISFGLTPAVILYVMTTASLPAEEVGLHFAFAGVSFLIAAFSALRLAKFNIDDTQHTEFCGLPTPANALFFASLGLIYAQTGADWSAYSYYLLAVGVVMACLLVSPIRMFAFKFQGFGWQGNQIRYGFILVALVLIPLLRLYAVPAIVLLYILLSTLRWVACRSKR